MDDSCKSIELEYYQKAVSLVRTLDLTNEQQEMLLWYLDRLKSAIEIKEKERAFLYTLCRESFRSDQTIPPRSKD